MATTTSLTSVSDLATMLHLSIAEDDAYAALIIRGASNAVRDAARQPSWVRKEESGDTLATGEVLAPDTAQDITLWVAVRAYTNPRNLSRRTSGPISETFREGVYGLELTDSEFARIEALRPAGNSGLWIQPIAGGKGAYGPILIPSELTPAGDPFHIADEGQFPYNDGTYT